MIWNKIEDGPPNSAREVLVTDGYGSFAVAWWHDGEYNKGNGFWVASDDMLAADNYDGGCSIDLIGSVTEWAEINHPEKEK